MYNDTLHDLRVKYDNTFVGLRLPSNAVLPFFVDEIHVSESDDYEDYDPDDPENCPASICSLRGRIFHDTENFEHCWQFESNMDEENLIFDYPPLGVVEVGPTAMMTDRIANLGSPMKYRKTPTYEGIEIINPSNSDLRMLGIYMDSGMIIPELLYNSWNNQPYRSIEEAVELLTTGQRIGCALSPHYSIHSTSESDNLRIAREGLWVGSYIPELNQVWLNNQNLIGYFEELSELGFDVNKEDFEQDQPPVFQAVDNGLHNITIEDIVTQTHTLNSVWESETEAQLDFSLESMMEA